MNRPKAGESILVIAGASQSLVNFRGPLLRAMQEAGHRVAAAAPDLGTDRSAKAWLDSAGVDGHIVPLSRTGLNPFADARLLGSLVRLIRRIRPTVVLGYTVKPVAYGLIAAQLIRVPRRYALITGLGYAFTGKASGKRRLVQSISKLLYRLALGRATKVFFQNRDDLALFRELGALPRDVPVAIVDGSGVDLDHFQATALPSGPLRFLLVARLLAVKGIREYAAAADILRQRYPEVEFHLVGGLDSNPDALNVEEVTGWQRDGILIWHGEVVDVRPFIADAHVYVLPSYREGTPRSTLEAMAMGRPIVTTDAPGCRETVIEGENGLLVPPQSVEPLAEAMERFIAQPQLIPTMGERSRRLAESRYDVRKVNAAMLKEMELA